MTGGVCVAGGAGGVSEQTCSRASGSRRQDGAGHVRGQFKASASERVLCATFASCLKRERVSPFTRIIFFVVLLRLISFLFRI